MTTVLCLFTHVGIQTEFLLLDLSQHSPGYCGYLELGEADMASLSFFASQINK